MNLSKISYDLTSITIGIHKLERNCNDGNSLLDREGLVPIWAGNEIVIGRNYKNWGAVRSDLESLEIAVNSLQVGERRTFLVGMVTSLKLAVRLFSGGSPTFEQKIVGLVGAPRGHEDAGMIASCHDRIDHLLTRLGFTNGTLRDRITSWENDRVIHQSDLPGVAAKIMDESKRRTDEMIFDTGDFSMEIRPVHDVPYAARCDFNDKSLDLNLDMLFSRAALKHILCHNIFPGHATQILYSHNEVLSGRATSDALLVSANAITGCVQEGIGEQGIYLIDWVEDIEDELTAELRNLRSAAQTSATWAYMAEGQPAEQTIKYLRETGLGQDAWVSGRLRTAAHPFKGPFAASFWAGNEAVRRVRERVPNAKRNDFIHFLYGRAHSVQSLEMFQSS